MSSGGSNKKEGSLDDLLFSNPFLFDIAKAQYFVSTDSQQIGLNIDCIWNQPLMLNIKIVDGQKIYKPTQTAIMIYKNLGKELKTSCGIIAFYKPINVGDPICDAPETLGIELVAEKEAFEGICDILFKYKQQLKIKVEVKKIRENVWDVTKEKNLAVTKFSVFTEKT